ncbi:MAG: molybdopterin-dependent oxidoreductase [Deltaproteobacteria bacterium]|nr:molybdopterin-dependent oxidoreductase [Deltaproteobacteria bacterium]
MKQDAIHWLKTHCGRMDHGGCALLVGVQDNTIVKVKGDPDGFLNRGYVCPKGLASPDRLNHPDRLKHPLRRIGDRGAGKWKKISWSEAIGTISDHFQQIREAHGARSVAFCQGMPKGIEHFVLIRLANTFGSPNVVSVQDVCHAPREVTGIHTCGFYPVADFHHKSKLVLVWGSNLTSTNEEGEICRLLLDQLKNGTDLIVVDPRRTELARKAALWLQLRPGTDSALALGFLHVIVEEGLFDRDFVDNWTHGFDELARHVKGYSLETLSAITWVPPDLIQKAARRYARSQPAAIQWGNAIEQHNSTFDTARALVILMAVCGNLDVEGGNIQANEPGILPLGKFVRADLFPDKWKKMIHTAHHTIPKLMTVPPAFLRKAILDEFPYPVKGAYVQCSNPLLAYADSRLTHEALHALDFLAVADVMMTPTAALADVVLPVATQFEFNDIGHYGLGHGYILARPKVVDPPGECWSDIRILNELGRAMTSKEYWFDDPDDLLEALLKPSGLTYARFAEQGYLKGDDRFRKYETSGFKTPTGKVELYMSTTEKSGVKPLPEAFEPQDDDPEFPLVLTSAKDPYYMHSSYRWVAALRKKSPGPRVEIHPDTAAPLGIHEGRPVKIETPYGHIIQSAHLTESVHPRVVNAAYGWWFPERDITDQDTWTRSNFNMLTTAGPLGKEFGTPNLKGVACRIASVDKTGEY